MKSIYLHPHEVAEVSDGGIVTMLRIIKLREFQPSQTPGYDWTFRYRSCWQNYPTDMLLLSKHTPYKLGVILYARESLTAPKSKSPFDIQITAVDIVNESGTWCWQLKGVRV